MKRLRQEGDVYGSILQGQPLELSATPCDVGHAAPARERAAAFEHVARAIDRDDFLRPTGSFDREIPVAAPEIRHDDWRKEQAQRARPGGPASSRHQLTLAIPVRCKALFAQAEHFLQPGLVCADEGIAGATRELFREHVPDGLGGTAVLGASSAVVRVAAFFLLFDETALLQQPEMPRNARLGDPQHTRELGHIEAFLAEQAQDPEARLVAEHPVERGRRLHIYKSTFIDVDIQGPGLALRWTIARTGKRENDSRKRAAGSLIGGEAVTSEMESK